MCPSLFDRVPERRLLELAVYHEPPSVLKAVCLSCGAFAVCMVLAVGVLLLG